MENPDSKIKYPFIGKDRRKYYSFVELREANEAYMKRMFYGKNIRGKIRKSD